MSALRLSRISRCLHPPRSGWQTRPAPRVPPMPGALHHVGTSGWWLRPPHFWLVMSSGVTISRHTHPTASQTAFPALACNQEAKGRLHRSTARAPTASFERHRKYVHPNSTPSSHYVPVGPTFADVGPCCVVGPGLAGTTKQREEAPRSGPGAKGRPVRELVRSCRWLARRRGL
jgi:hypothetical protein